MRPVVDGNCTLCFGVLSSPIYIIEDDLLEHLQFLNNNLDANLIRKSSVCRSCVKSVREAQIFKTSYLLSGDRSSPGRKNIKGISLKEEIESEELQVCQICKSFEHYCVPLSDIIETEKLLKIVDSLSLESNPLTCGCCQSSLLNLGNILILLSVYNKSEEHVKVDDLSINVNQLSSITDSSIDIDKRKTKTVKKKADFKSPSSSLMHHSSEIIKLEKEEVTIEEENIHITEQMIHTQEEDIPIQKGDVHVQEEDNDIQEDIHNQIEEVHIKEGINDEVRTDTLNLYLSNSDCETSSECIQTKKRKKSERAEQDKIECLKPQCSFSEVKEQTNKQRKNLMYKCVKCTFQSVFKAKVAEHLLSDHKMNTTNFYNCSLCDFVTDRNEYLQCHTMIHKLIKENKIPPELAKDLLFKKHINAQS